MRAQTALRAAVRVSKGHGLGVMHRRLIRGAAAVLDWMQTVAVYKPTLVGGGVCTAASCGAACCGFGDGCCSGCVFL